MMCDTRNFLDCHGRRINHSWGYGASFCGVGRCLASKLQPIQQIIDWILNYDK